ncbi:hypothetical protein PR048_020220 [Dryococelus australis]|uniref:Uncharacterized protein n=1 Tax=Dryococelus australis TaxID=614101 RepID=A0ABQ9H5T2_9NEOP|nr:hypothetical protein PR048_020220 [Dryococelus australis]
MDNKSMLEPLNTRDFVSLLLSDRQSRLAPGDRRLPLHTSDTSVTDTEKSLWWSQYRNQFRRACMRFCTRPEGTIEKKKQMTTMVHPLVSQQPLKRQFHKIYQDLRMSMPSFDDLLVLVGDRITYQTNNMKKPMCPEER